MNRPNNFSSDSCSLRRDEENFHQLERHLLRTGLLIKEIREQEKLGIGQLKTIDKDDGTLVTQADLLACRSISSAIKNLFPGDFLLSEENSISIQEFTANPKREYVWIVDPLDNTRGYTKGKDDYSILLTRLRKGQPTDAFIVHPSRNSLVKSHLDIGVFYNGKQISVSQTSLIKEARRLGVYTQERFSANISNLPLESTEGIIAVAKGDIDIAYINMCGHKIWDIVFVTLLVEEAGGKVTDEIGKALSFNGVEPNFQWVVASNGQLHNASLTLLNSLLET